jgi:Methyltransferase FkbM domain
VATNSSQSSRAAKISAAIILTLALCGGAGYLGYRAGEGNLMYRFFAEMVETQDRMPVVIEYMIGRTTSYALYGQDLWLLNHVYPGVHNGFFVDLGSADGEADSNSKLLEIHGWSGICIDPFPSNMDNRSCRMFKEVVDGEAGRMVRFQQPGSFSGGILDYAGWWVDAKARETTVELTTTTLADILKRAGAPSFINYMSVDIEGAEYEALRAFPFDEYRIGAVTVEHNDVQDRRKAIRHLLESHGYRLERAILDQDWYMLDSVRSAGPRAD